jgi:hypothetical protein
MGGFKVGAQEPQIKLGGRVVFPSGAKALHSFVFVCGMTEVVLFQNKGSLSLRHSSTPLKAGY